MVAISFQPPDEKAPDAVYQTAAGARTKQDTTKHPSGLSIFTSEDDCQPFQHTWPDYLPDWPADAKYKPLVVTFTPTPENTAPTVSIGGAGDPISPLDLEILAAERRGWEFWHRVLNDATATDEERFIATNGLLLMEEVGFVTWNNEREFPLNLSRVRDERELRERPGLVLLDQWQFGWKQLENDYVATSDGTQWERQEYSEDGGQSWLPISVDFLEQYSRNCIALYDNSPWARQDHYDERGYLVRHERPAIVRNVQREKGLYDPPGPDLLHRYCPELYPSREARQAERVKRSEQKYYGAMKKAIEKDVAKSEPIANYEAIEDEDSNEEPEKKPLPMRLMLLNIRNATNNWPRAAAGELFVADSGGKVSFIEGSEGFFGWLGSSTNQVPDFVSKSGFHSKAEAFKEFKRTAKQYRMVESLPHEPPIEGIYYANGEIKSGKGEAIKELLSMFCPETEVDRQLILAAILSTFWGGRGGGRPVFAITSDHGRGVGKTTVPVLIGRLAGGVLDFEKETEIAKMKERLLSPDGLTKRVVLLDNLKSAKFSHAELEGLTTNSEISGKRLYVGEASRPNTLLWCITVNGPAFVEDMAQRCVFIKLGKPTHSGCWRDEAEAFIDSHREEIIADVLAILREKPGSLERYSRWGDWERNVLSKLHQPAEIQRVILERQREYNADQDEAGLVADEIIKQLKRLHYDPDREVVFIPSSVMVNWYNWATKENKPTTGASQAVGRMIESQSEPLRSLTKNLNNKLGRGFRWAGSLADPSASIWTDIQQRLAEAAANR